MRQFNKLVITSLLCSLTACVPVIDTNSKIETKLSQVILLGEGEGGNPEVNLNQCFGLKNEARQGCFDIFYPDDINITIYPRRGDIITLVLLLSIKQKSI